MPTDKASASSQRPPVWLVVIWIVSVAPLRLAFRLPLWLLRKAWRIMLSAPPRPCVIEPSVQGTSGVRDRHQGLRDSGAQEDPATRAPRPALKLHLQVPGEDQRRDCEPSNRRVTQLDPTWNEDFVANFTASLHKDLKLAREQTATVQTDAKISIMSLKSRIYELEAREGKLVHTLQQGRSVIQQLASEVQAAEESGVNVQPKLLSDLRLLDGELAVALMPECSSTDASPALDQAAAGLFHTPVSTPRAKAAADSIACIASPNRQASLVPVSKTLTYPASPATGAIAKP